MDEFNKGVAFAIACFEQGRRDEIETIQLLRDRIRLLEGIIARVHDELHDPMSERWCDKPKKDRKLLESLRDYIDGEMGWDLCDTCQGTKRVVDVAATREVIDTIEGSGYEGDCFGFDISKYMPCPQCQKEK
ncbi:MAG: hypothetical protein MJA29_00295 [Candidatus Omnitrophica bacterium]|nr:hypothetical protein [Candidatus Omnitrophota bacterium]